MDYYLDVWRAYFDFSGHTVLAATGELLALGLYRENVVVGSIFGSAVVL